MTNQVASQKRPLEDDDTVRGEEAKRKREGPALDVLAKRDSKDWRDVHLKSNDDDGARRRRDEGRDRERRRASPVADDLEEGEMKEEGEISPPAREPSPPPSAGGPRSKRDYRYKDSDRSRDRDRDRDRSRDYRHRDSGRDSRRYRDSDRDRDRDRDRNGYHSHRRPHNRSRSRSPRSSRRGSAAPSGLKKTSTVGSTDSRPVSPPASSRMPSPKPVVQDVTMAEPEPEPEEEEPQKTEEEILAEKRAKRAAIKAKYEASLKQGNGDEASPAAAPPSAIQVPVNGAMAGASVSSAVATPSTVVKDALAKVTLGTPDATTPARQRSVSPPPPSAGLPQEDEPESMFELAKGDPDESGEQTAERDGEDKVNAADYDPSLDRREDEKRRFGIENANGEAKTNGAPQEVMDVDAEEEEEEEEVTDDEAEDDVDDMFAIHDEPKVKKTKKVKKKKAAAPVGTIVPALAAVDSAADEEGYYRVILGEQIDNGRYQVSSLLGKGMFAQVVRCRVLKDENGNDIAGEGETSQQEVAIKLIRCQETMYKAGLKEAQILQKLRALDPEDKKHVVKLVRTFEHRGHLCLVFENMSMNLREVVKRFGKDVGLNLRAVRAYAHQLFLSLGLLKKANVMHADIKPDNILVNEQKTLLKLCDLGSASDASENDITPYLVSRFYRAPEIILGVPYDPALDMWSIGCTLYELYTGKILFPGRSNNHMLRLMMELKGRFNSKIIKKAAFGSTYFDELGNFESIEVDKLSGNPVVKKVHISAPVRDLRSRIMPPNSVLAKMRDEESKMLLDFVDLLDKCLMLDPARRLTPREALGHAFIRG